MLKGRLGKNDIGLALGSGSAKGITHIGVIEALESNGFNIKSISGTSMGAIVASYYAFGKLDILKNWFLTLDKKETFKTIDFSITGGFISGNRLMKSIEDQLGDVNFEDAHIPLYIPATNLDLGTEEIFYKGPVLPAIRASISIPGVLKPYFHDGYYYVDGAVTDPVPVDILADNGCKNIVAVNLYEYIEPRDSGEAPGFLDATFRSMSIISRYLSKSRIDKATTVIQPDLSDIGMFHMYRAKDIMNIGKTLTQKMIDNKEFQKPLSSWKKFFRKQK